MACLVFLWTEEEEAKVVWNRWIKGPTVTFSSKTLDDEPCRLRPITKSRSRDLQLFAAFFWTSFAALFASEIELNTVCRAVGPSGGFNREIW